MKEQAIKRINTIGKVSSVIVLIAKILMGVGIGLLLLCTVIPFVFPEDFVVMSTDSDVEIKVNLSSVGLEYTEDELVEAQQEVTQSIVEENGDILDVTVTEDYIVMTGVAEDVSFSLRDLGWLIMLGLIALVMTFITLIFVGGLCKAFRDCQSPFEDRVIKKMQHLAYSLIPWAATSTITNSITESITTNKPSFMFSIDLGIILVVLVVLVLVYIFKYGAVLQQESDETL